MATFSIYRGIEILIVSAIDIGSNAIRMIVGQKQNGRLVILKKVREPVRLGQDVFFQGEISDETIKKALAAFEKFSNYNRKFEVKTCRAVATSATREAKNKQHFVDSVFKASKIQIEVIDGQKEAELIHSAVANELDLKGKTCMGIDVGGGSVEITFSKDGKMINTKSFPMGTVRILEKLKTQKFDESKLNLVLGDFVKPIHDFIQENEDKIENIDFAVGTGGNLEALGRLKLQLLKKTPNTYVTLKELVDISKKLKSTSIKDRIEKLEMRPDRADVILPATMNVKMILRLAGVDKILIPCVGLRDGLLLSLFEK